MSIKICEFNCFDVTKTRLIYFHSVLVRTYVIYQIKLFVFLHFTRAKFRFVRGYTRFYAASNRNCCTQVYLRLAFRCCDGFFEENAHDTKEKPTLMSKI